MKWPAVLVLSVLLLGCSNEGEGQPGVPVDEVSAGEAKAIVLDRVRLHCPEGTAWLGRLGPVQSQFDTVARSYRISFSRGSEPSISFFVYAGTMLVEGLDRDANALLHGTHTRCAS